MALLNLSGATATLHVVLRKREPLASNDPVIGATCEGCQKLFKPGDVIALVPLGPGGDPANRAACLEGAAHQVVSIPVHWACATGQE
jgi:hypothetical protein